MRLNLRLRRLARVLAAALVGSCIVTQPLFAQAPTTTTPAQPPTLPSTDPAVQGSVWPALLFSGLFGGPSDDLTHYFERYGLRTGFGHDRRAAPFADADVALVYHNGRRDLFTIDRRVWTRYNQRGTARFDSNRVRFSGGYGYFRQGANGLDYLFGPSVVSGGVDPAYTGGTVGYLGQFNDSVSDALFATTRLTYDVAFQVKPASFGDKATASVAVRGIERSGRVFESLNTGGGDVLGTDADRRAKLRWQGYESRVDESTNELSFTAGLRPNPAVNIDYELAYERFRNDAPTMTFTDLAAATGVRIVSTTAEAGAEGAFAASVADWPLHFVADSNMVRQSLRAGAGNDRILVSAGAGWNALTQESFTHPQLEDGYRQGDIESNQMFATFAAHPTSPLRLEAYVRRSETNRNMDRFEAKFRLNRFSQWAYGAEAEMRSNGGRLAVTPGWSRRTVDRDIEFGDVRAERTLIRADSASDEIFVRTRWKVSPRVSLRVTPSVLWADETGYVTEPERAAKMNLALTYTTSSGLGSSTVFYTIRTRRNDQHSFVGSDGVAVTQDARGSLQQLGIAATATPLETASVFWSYAWSRDEYNANLLSGTTRRYDATPVFYSRDDRQTYLLGSHTVTVGADVTPAGRMQYGVSYTATRTAGDIASGRVLSLLPAEDGRISNWYHTAALRAERDLGRSLSLAVSYLIDYYSDASYEDLTGGLHSLLVSVGYRF